MWTKDFYIHLDSHTLFDLSFLVAPDRLIGRQNNFLGGLNLLDFSSKRDLVIYFPFRVDTGRPQNTR